ncbi:hypothetical protein BDR03DRAFT_976517 [Suillus americanus]|nr:hypothetical protein BDR03DRAFT_976517 [Suillus americanus]
MPLIKILDMIIRGSASTTSRVKMFLDCRGRSADDTSADIRRNETRMYALRDCKSVSSPCMQPANLRLLV